MPSLSCQNWREYITELGQGQGFCSVRATQGPTEHPRLRRQPLHASRSQQPTPSRRTHHVKFLLTALRCSNIVPPVFCSFAGFSPLFSNPQLLPPDLRQRSHHTQPVSQQSRRRPPMRHLYPSLAYKPTMTSGLATLPRYLTRPQLLTRI